MNPATPAAHEAPPPARGPPGSTTGLSVAQFPPAFQRLPKLLLLSALSANLAADLGRFGGCAACKHGEELAIGRCESVGVCGSVWRRTKDAHRLGPSSLRLELGSFPHFEANQW